MDAACRLLIRIGGGPLARAWIVGPGDSCASCAMAPDCPERRRCLHLVASAGSTLRIDGPFRRFPFGARRVGQVASTREPYVTHEALETLADAAWLSAHRVSGFGAWPLVDRGRMLGVIAAFTRRGWDDEARRDAEATATMLAAAIGAPDPPRTVARGRDAERDSATTPARTLADIQRDAIESVLARTGGRVSGPLGAARILGLKPTTLISRMQKLAVRRPPRRP